MSSASSAKASSGATSVTETRSPASALRATSVSSPPTPPPATTTRMGLFSGIPEASTLAAAPPSGKTRNDIADRAGPCRRGRDAAPRRGTVAANAMLDAARDDRRLIRLIEVGRSLLSELDLDVVLDRVLATARDLTGAQYAALGILDERRRELAQFLTRGVDQETHRAIGDLPRGRGILGLLIEDPRPLRLTDLGDHPRSYGFPPGHPPMRGVLGVPILIRGEAWGNLYLTEKAAGDFDRDDEDAVVVLAYWAAIAIENARLYRAVDARRAELD